MVYHSIPDLQPSSFGCLLSNSLLAAITVDPGYIYICDSMININCDIFTNINDMLTLDRDVDTSPLPQIRPGRNS